MAIVSNGLAFSAGVIGYNGGCVGLVLTLVIWHVAQCYDPRTCRAPIFLFPSCPLSLLTHLGPLPLNSHQPLPIYSTDPLMRTLVP